MLKNIQYILKFKLTCICKTLTVCQTPWQVLGIRKQIINGPWPHSGNYNIGRCPMHPWSLLFYIVQARCTFLSRTHLIILQLPLYPKDGTLMRPSVIPWMSSIFLSKCGLLNVFLILHHFFHEGLQCIHFSLQMLANFPRSSHHSVWRPSKPPGLHPVTVADPFGGPPMHSDDLYFPFDFFKYSIYPTHLYHG